MNEIPKTHVEIFNLSGQRVAVLQALYPLTKQGQVLRYSKELSDWGECTFRVSTRDPLFSRVGDVFIPREFFVKVLTDGAEVWSGVIVDNPSRNRLYVEVRAVQLLYFLDKVLIRRDSEVIPGDGRDNYKLYNSGTMASAVQTIINNAIADFGSNHPLSSMTIGEIQNPDYPIGFTGETGTALTGGWNFSDFVALQFDYHTAYYVLKAFGIYANCDFEIELDPNTNLPVFNFKTFLGRQNTNITFEYGRHGNIVDYDVPRFGQRMVNDLWAIAADTEGKILHVNQRDEASIQSAGISQGVSSFIDVKDMNFLKIRANEELRFLRSVDDSPMNVLLDERLDRSGEYGIGDVVTMRIKDNVIDFEQPRRIVGITTTIHNTGKRLITVQTNKPKQTELS